MFINKLYLYFVLTFTLVIANPVMQRLPVQQISFQNSQIEPVNQQTSSRYSFSPQVSSKVQAIPSVQPYQPSPPFDANLIVEKILSNPTLTAILNPSMYAQNGVEKNKQNSLFKSTETPTIVNNYIIIPADYLKLNETKIVQNEKDNVLKRPKQKVKNSKMSKPKRQQNRELVDMNENLDLQEETIENQKPNNRLERDEQSIHGISGIDALKPDNRLKLHEQSVNELNRINTNSSLTLESKNTVIPLSIKSTSIKNVATIRNDSNVDKLTVSALAQTEKSKRKRNKSKNKNTISRARNSTQNVLEGDDVSLTITKNAAGNNSLINSKTNQSVDFNNKSVISSPPSGRGNRTYNQNINTEIINTSTYGHKYAENRLPRNPNEVTIIHNLRKKYPGVPEEVIRNLMFLIKRQLQQEQSQMTPNNFFYPQYNFPINYNELYRSLPFKYFNEFNSTHTGNKRKKGSRRNSQRPSKRNKIKSNKNSKSPNTNNNGTLDSSLDKNKMVENATANTLNLPSQITKTVLQEVITLTPVKPDTDVHANSIILPLQDESSKVSKEYHDFDSQDFKIPEIGSEDEIPNIYDNRLIEDYFPDFTADNKAYLTSGEFSSQDLREDRYYYTTNRNTKISGDEIVNTQFSQDKPNLHARKDDDNEIITNKNSNLNLNSISEVELSEDSEQIQFRTPPSLEKPDFVSRKIYKVPFIDYDPYAVNSYQSNIDDFEPYEYSDSSLDKLSTYSDVKTPDYDIRVKPANDIERIKVHSKIKQAKNDEIITVYAQSRVANYGHNVNDSESASEQGKNLNAADDIISD